MGRKAPIHIDRKDSKAVVPSEAGGPSHGDLRLFVEKRSLGFARDDG
jgi:hypothetical protein